MADLFKSAAEAGAEVRRLGHLPPNDQRDPALTQLGEMATGGMQAVGEMTPAAPRRGIERPVVSTPQDILNQYMNTGSTVNDKAQSILDQYMGGSSPEPTPEVPETQGSFVGDIGRSVTRGGIALGTGFYELLNLATRGELDTASKKMFGTSGTEAFTSARNSLNQADSTELQKQRKQLNEADGFWSSVGTVLTNPRLAGSMAVEMVPQMASVLGAAKVAATRVLASQLAKGVAKDVAQEAAKKAATMTVMGVNPALEAGMAASDTRSAILQMSEEDLGKSPQYQQLLTQGYTPVDARARLANDAATIAAAITAPISLVSNSLTASFEAKLVAPGAAKHFGLKALGKEVGTGLVKEVPGEALEEGGSQFGQNVGTKLSGANPNQDIWQGVPQAAGAGAALGGVAGVGFGAANARFGLTPASQDKGNTPGTPATTEPPGGDSGGPGGTSDNAGGAATRAFDGTLDDETFNRTMQSRNIVPAMTAMWATSDPQTQSQIEELARRNNMFVNFAELAADGRTLDRGVELLNQAGGAFVQSFLNRTAQEVSNPLKDQPLPPKTQEETPEDLQRRSEEADAIDSGEAAVASAEDAGIEPRLTEQTKALYMQGYQRRIQNIEASNRPAERVLMATSAIQDMIRQGFTPEEAHATFGRFVNPETNIPNSGTNVPNMGTTQSFEQTKQSLIDNYKAKYGIDVKPEEIIEVPVDKGIAQIAQQFGVPVYAYRYTGGQRKIQLIKGSRAGSGIALNANAPDAHMNVFGHEVYHELAKRDPEAARQLNEAIKQYLSEEGKKKYADWLKRSNYDPESHGEEVTADVLGVMFTDAEFWAQLNQKNPTLIEKILAVVTDLVERLSGLTQRGAKMKGFITDYAAVRDLLAGFVNETAAKKPAEAAPVQEMADVDPAEEVKRLAREGKKAEAARAFRDADLYKQTGIPFERFYAEATKPVTNVTENVTEETPVRWAEEQPMRNLNPNVGITGTYNANEKPAAPAADVVEQERMEKETTVRRLLGSTLARKGSVGYFIYQVQKKLGVKAFTVGDLKKRYADGVARRQEATQKPIPKKEKAPEPKQMELGSDVVDQGTMARFARRLDEIMGELFAPSKFRAQIAALDRQLEAMSEANRKKAEDGEKPRSEVEYIFENLAREGAFGADEIAALQAREKELSTLNKDETGAFKSEGVAASNPGAALREKIVALQKMEVRQRAKALRENIDKVDDALTQLRSEMEDAGIPQNLIDDMLLEKERGVNALIESKDKVKDESLPQMVENELDVNMEDTTADMFGDKSIVAAQIVDAMLAQGEITDIRALHRIFDEFDAAGLGNLDIYNEMRLRGMEIPARQYNWASRPGYQYSLDYWMKKNKGRDSYRVREEWFASLDKTLREMNSDADRNEIMNGLTAEEKKLLADWRQQRADLNKRLTQKAENIEGEVYLFDSVNDAYPHALFNKYPLSSMFDIEKIPEADRPALLALVDGKADMLPSLWYQDLNTVLSERPDFEGEVFETISADERARYEEWRTRATREYLRNAQALANSPAFSQLFQLQSYLTTEQYDQYRNQIALATQNQHGAILQAAWEVAEAQRLAQEKKGNVDTATDAVLQQVYNQDETSTDVSDVPAFSVDEEGDTTGDTFETEQAAVESEPSELLERVRLKTGRYSGVTTATDIFAHINQIVSKWANAPRFVVLNNHMQLSEELRDYVTQRLGKNLTAKGMLGPDGTVYLFSDFIESMDDAEFVFFHEIEGHYGLRAFLGDKLDGFLDAQYRTNKRVREAADAIIAEAADSGVGVSRLEATEEAIADLAASGKDQSLFATVVSALVKFLRQIRMDGVADWIQTQSLSNLGFVLSQARKAARNGTISPLAGAPSDIRLAAEKKPVEIFGVRKGQTTAYAMYNPLTANWTVFYNPNGLGATTFGIQTFDNYADALALVREHGKAISAKDHPKRKTYGPGSFNQVKIADVANVGKWTGIARQLYMKTVNKLLPVIEVVKQIEAQGGRTNLLQAITLYRGRIKPYWDQFRRDILRPISKHIKAVEDSGDTYKFDGVEYKGQDLIDLYLLALHAEERNKVIQGLDPEKKDGAGISTKEAKKIIEDLKGLKSYDDMVQVSILTQTLSQMKVNYMLQTDLINAAQSRGLGAYNYYVNLSGNKTDVDEAVNREMLGGRALNMRGNDARRALGRESIPVNILENTLNNYLATIVRGQKNIVAQSVYDMVVNNPDPNFAVVNPFVMVKVLDIDKLVADKVLLSMLGDEPTVASGQLFVNQLKSAVKTDPSRAAWAAGEMYNRLYVAFQQGRVSANQFAAMTQKIENADVTQRNVFTPEGYIKEEVDNDRMKRDDVMVVKIQGKPVLMEFRHGTDQDGKVGTFISAIHGRTEPSEGFSEFMGAISREIGQLITSRNLAWVPVNWMRDIGTAFFNAAVDPKVGMELARKMMARAPQSYAVAYKNLIKEEYADKNSPVYKLLKKFGSKPVDAQTQEMWDEFVKSGAQVFFIDRKDIQDQIKDMKEELNPSGGLKGTWNAYGKFTDLLGMPAEASARFAAYRTLREAGWSIEDAAVYAKNITVNFEQSGSLRAMRNFFMFANPSIQGSARLLQGMTIRTPDGKIRPNSKFLAMAGALAGFGLVMGFMARAFGDNGEDEVNDLDKIPRYKRATSVVIAPGVPFGSPLPMPYGWNVFYALGNFAADSMFGKTPVSQTASRVMASAVDSFWPLGQSDSGTALGAVVKSVTPTVVSPFYEYLMNESRFGGPIYKGDNPFVRTEEANSYRNFESASPVSVFMMRGLNSLTGGNQYKSGVIDINPAFVDYIAQAFLPGPATDVGRSINLGIRAAQGRDIKNVPLPLVDRFGSKVSEGWDAGAFRRAVTFVDTKYAEAKNATREERDVLLKEHPNLGNAKGALSNIDQTIRDMRTTLRGIESNPNIPFPQKVEARNRIEALEKMYHQKGVQIAIKAGFRQPLLADQ